MIGRAEQEAIMAPPALSPLEWQPSKIALYMPVSDELLADGFVVRQAVDDMVGRIPECEESHW